MGGLLEDEEVAGRVGGGVRHTKRDGSYPLVCYEYYICMCHDVCVVYFGVIIVFRMVVIEVCV